jgi:hypothetical protein
MEDDLYKARNFSESVRYSGDTLRVSGDVEHRDSDGLQSYFSLNSILVSPLVTPIIDKSVNKVIDRLHIPKDSVKAYVYASSEIQAECYAGNDTDCVVRLSSGLIDILEDEEIEFVIGHEIGHFLYSHSLAAASENNESLELSIQKRAQEISADRIGLLASESLDASIRAMMKTISGLSTKYLTFNVGGFLSQLSNTESFKSQISINSSHPSMLVRCRALLWFSMCDTFKGGSQDYKCEEVDKLNEKIRADIDKFVDAKAREKIDELKQDLALWLSASLIIEDGSFDKEEQEKFAKMFNQDTLDKLKRFLSSHNTSSLKKSIEDNIESSKRDLYNEIPTSFDNELLKINKKINKQFI